MNQQPAQAEVTSPSMEKIHMLYNAPLELSAAEAERERNPQVSSFKEQEDKFYKYFIDGLTARGYEAGFHLLQLSNYKEVIRSRIGDPKNQEVVVNFCDGAEVDGYPGLSIPRFLEEEGYLFVGPSSAFQEISTCKQKQKVAFQENNVPTAPYVNIDEWNEDIEQKIIDKNLKYPLFVKVADAYSSFGISDDSIVWNFNEVRNQVQKMLKSFFGKVVLEEFILGREFTVLIRDDGTEGDVIVYPPAERNFPSRDPFKKFLSAENVWDSSIKIIPVKELELAERLKEVTKAAYKACKGNCFARVDLRTRDETGEVFVLEVNDNCSLGPGSYSEEILLMKGENSVDLIEALTKIAIAKRAPKN